MIDRTARYMLALAACLSLPAIHASAQQEPKHLFFHIQLPRASAQPLSGRLLLFVSSGEGAKAVDMNPMSPAVTYVAAKEVSSWAPGDTVDIDADDLVYPGPLSDAKPGDYQAQAVLDVGHSYNYGGREAGDPISDVVPLKAWNPAGGEAPLVVLSGMASTPQPPSAPPGAPSTDQRPTMSAEELSAALKPIDFVSPSLSRFFGRDITMKGWVLLPPGYASNPQARYPTVYFTHGFGGTAASIRARFAPVLYERMRSHRMPEMIWVLLDESGPTGTHEFADGVNNGPWGHALVAELIPDLESHYRMDAMASGRFLQGHSSGGWATLWLQTTYPKIFGGTWSTSPDPSDFHDFSSVDLYAPHANLYRRADGSPVPIMRAEGHVVATMEQLAKMENVMGDYGGQLASFEWVFSPRGADGRPMHMFDRKTGDVDPFVIGYWREHYDIAHRIATDWPTLAPDLRGKIHLFVGTADTFYLDGAAHQLQHVLDGLGGDGHFTYIPDKSHFNLYQVGDDRYALFDQIAREMYAVARPAEASPAHN